MNAFTIPYQDPYVNDAIFVFDVGVGCWYLALSELVGMDDMNPRLRFAALWTIVIRPLQVRVPSGNAGLSSLGLVMGSRIQTGSSANSGNPLEQMAFQLRGATQDRPAEDWPQRA